MPHVLYVLRQYKENHAHMNINFGMNISLVHTCRPHLVPLLEHAHKVNLIYANTAPENACGGGHVDRLEAVALRVLQKLHH